VAAGPLSGLREMMGITTVKTALAEFPAPSKAATVCGPETAVLETVKFATKVPPAELMTDGGIVIWSSPSNWIVIEERLAKLPPLTRTEIPVGPVIGSRDMNGRGLFDEVVTV